MLSDTVKIVLVVACPTVFTALMICLGLIYRRRTNRASAALASSHQDESHQEIPAQSNDLGLRAGLGPSVALPAYEEKTIDVRRLSAYPEMDKIRRVSSVTTTLGAVAAEGGERARRGSVASMASSTTLVVTDMGDGYVGVERRASIPEVPKVPVALRSGSVSSMVSGKKDPGSPRDKRFSTHLPHIVPPLTSYEVDTNQPMETLKTPLPISPSVMPRPVLRSPTKTKDRRDSIELAIWRSPTLAVHPPLPPPTSKTPSTEQTPTATEANILFKEWEGFSAPSAPTAPNLVIMTEKAGVKGFPDRGVGLEEHDVNKVGLQEASAVSLSSGGLQAGKVVSPAGFQLPPSPP